MITERKPSYVFLVLISLVVLFLAYSPIAHAQNWAAMPPYNTLWPLWSPALSPLSATTGLPTPVVTNLAPGTILPVEPGLTWDPAAVNPWLLYNTPVGMAYYDPIAGVNPWPPSYLKDAVTGLPLPLTLPGGYSLLLPTSSAWLSSNVPLGNAAALNYLVPFALPTPPVYLGASAIAPPSLVPVTSAVVPVSTNVALSALIASLLIKTGNPQVQAVLLLIAADPTLLTNPALLNSLVYTGNTQVAAVLALLSAALL